MSKKYPSSGRSEAEIRVALETIQRLEAATSEEDILNCFRAIPHWVFAEIPAMREAIQRLVPVALASLKDLASRGDEEATRALIGVLEANPHLQGNFPAKDD